MSGFEATPHEDFAVFDAAFTVAYAGKEWPEECARMHLRWLVGERLTKAMRANDWPTVRVLATKWGWKSIERVSRFLTRTVEADVKVDGETIRVTMLHWQDPYRRVPLEELRGDRMMGANRSKPNGGRTGGEREANGGRTADTEQPAESETNPNGGRTGGEREANGGRTPRASSPRASTEHRTPIHSEDTEPAPASGPPGPSTEPPVAVDPEAVPTLLTPTLDPTFPKWAPNARECHGHDRREVVGMVLDVIGAVRGKVVTKPDECATDAKEILGLWKTVGYPAPSTMARDLGDVVEWAQRSPDRLAARDIRAEGWADGVDRSRAIGTLCVRRSWGDRLAAAKDWIARGRPTRGPAARASPTAAEENRRLARSALDNAIHNLQREKPWPPTTAF